jgi:NADH dehydrogenase [ubiquinone] 1 alpha subcomplex assembly factor 7
MSNVPADRTDLPLLDVLRARIAQHGLMPVDEYMRACLEHPRHGYWQRAATIGAGGDFVTAPEISQVFGELIGLWSAVVWQGLGQPSPLRLVELGPGRGTLMRDAWRAARAMPQFLDAATIHLIEVSAPLREVQRRTLLPPSSWGRAGEGGSHDGSRIPPPLTPPHRGEGNSPAIVWHRVLDQVPPGAAIVVANEFLDALPIRQLVHHEDAWHERVIEVSPESGLQFAVGPRVEFNGTAPENGAIVEVRAGEDELLRALSLRAEPCMALFIDYGPAEPSIGDTLQAVRRHAYADPLVEPGTADLTAHVQFAALAAKAHAAGLATHGPITQAEFLGRLGIVERTRRLMTANPDRAGEIETAVQRLISPGGMGGLFKAMAVGSPHLPPPPPFG